MPGWTEQLPWARCQECDGPDVGSVGFFIHDPTCSTQPNHEKARRKRAREIRRRRKEIDTLVASADAQRLCRVRTIGRLD